ncbi:hypothetical protein GNP94_05315 [Paenibacillus campinasensis]|uniref:Uncharacterized protein n=1 Tax=Paenibacillus campinasensis TaxID=66347 RepID=A0ABW9SWR9_9BACL|nr:hypothetical protein [Paenibacillus campinasensis]MUG65424.1 hypothetical protein [Paenibacillus campinasensis]
MTIERNGQYLSQDIHFFTAALSTVWEEDPAGVYIEIERGFIEGYSSEVVHVRNVASGSRTSYNRDTVMFQRI